MKELQGASVKLLDSELLRRERANKAYMLRLTRENLMRNYLLEAGLWSSTSITSDMHGGWESATCQLRGHFTGHWLSAAAMLYSATGDAEIKGRADAMVSDLARCQRENGNGWAGSIPEKYFDWIARGKGVWAPHYTVHKTFMGLIDMYLYAGNAQALDIAVKWGEWFDAWSAKFTREEMDDILDVETGGMLEIWAELLSITGEDRWRRLLLKYDRPRLFDELLSGNDPLTNMHANTTIPEVLGCARAYEVTGELRYRKICEAYWKCAVTERGAYSTGAQTCGEVWSPKNALGARLGDKAQEHCTVYNMMRLANFLYCWTHEARYADYIERNLYNGIMAQSYWTWNGVNTPSYGNPTSGLLTYFLPMQGGARKGWASETNDFFCCHGTLVQANAQLNRYIYYQEGNDLYICQFFDSEAELTIDGQKVRIRQTIDRQTGSFHLSSDSAARHTIGAVTSRVTHNPDMLRVYVEVFCDKPVKLNLHMRVPFWAEDKDCEYYTPDKCVWSNGDNVCYEVPRRIWTKPLPDDPERVAFMYGPIALAGLTDAECTLHVDPMHPETALRRANEREWGKWTEEFLTVTEERAIRFLPLYSIGYDRYTVYFRVNAQKM